MTKLAKMHLKRLKLIIIGIVCLIIYIYGKIFLIKIGIIEENKANNSERIKKED